jgi:hypothetical protein
MIYFIETQGRVKIGYSNDPQRRFSDLTVGCPTRCVLLAIIEGSMSDEKDLHERFKANRIRGEWFELTPEISDFMASRAIEPRVDAASSGNNHPLAQYLRANEIGVGEFSRMVGLSRVQLWRIMNGDNTLLDTMFTIIEATNGDVSADDFMEVWSAKRRQILEVAA